MKLRNATKRLVNIPTSQGRIIIQPMACIDMSNLRLRKEVEKYVKQFGLTWELDDADFPAGVDPSRYKGGHSYAMAHTDDTKFDANAVRHQEDAKEIVDVWSPVIEDEFAEESAEEDQMEDLLFIKETVEDEKTTQGSEVGKETLTKGAFGKEEEDIGAREEWFQARSGESSEEVPSEGPDYLREEPPEGLDIYCAPEPEETFIPDVKSDYQKIDYAQAPPNCPYTKSQLQLGVKSTLWEICDQLGLNQEGTKGDLINRIFQYYDHNL
jgi:hypothetical protein